jgi:hypothetical protein
MLCLMWWGEGRHVVVRLAAQAGLVAVPHPKRFDYDGNFVELFFVSKASELGGYFRLAGVSSIGDVNTWSTAPEQVAHGDE